MTMGGATDDYASLGAILIALLKLLNRLEQCCVGTCHAKGLNLFSRIGSCFDSHGVRVRLVVALLRSSRHAGHCRRAASGGVTVLQQQQQQQQEQGVDCRGWWGSPSSRDGIGGCISVLRGSFRGTSLLQPPCLRTYIHTRVAILGVLLLDSVLRGAIPIVQETIFQALLL